MTATQRRKQVQKLAKQDLSAREIARRLGTHHSTVIRDLKPLICPRCDKPGIAPKSKLCRTCYREVQSQSVNDRGDEIAKMWNSGASLEAIAKRFGWTVSHIGMEMHRLREKGFDLPYRRVADNPKFKNQVKK